MAKIVVRNIDPGIDGEYEFVSINEFSFEEWQNVRKVTGLVLGDFVSAEDEGKADAGVFVGLAMVACERAGKPRPHLLLKQGKLGDIDVVPDEADVKAEADALPPEPQTVTEPVGEPVNEDGNGSSGLTFNELPEESRAALLAFSGASG